MDEYKIINYLAEHPNVNKDRPVLILGCTSNTATVCSLAIRHSAWQSFSIGTRETRHYHHSSPHSRPFLVHAIPKYYSANFSHFTDFLVFHDQIIISPSTIANISKKDMSFPQRWPAQRKNKQWITWQLKKLTAATREPLLHIESEATVEPFQNRIH